MELRRYVEAWSHNIALLRQNRLLSESAFITFARSCGLPVFGTVTGDPGMFHSKRCLLADEIASDGSPLFHPFRLYPLVMLLQKCDLQIARSASLSRQAALGLFKMKLQGIPEDREFERASKYWNEIVDLATLLEPIYWPDISGQVRRPGVISESEYNTRLAEYRQQALDLVRGLDSDVWRETHRHLRIQAAWMDDNPELYILLRVGSWEQREKLKGRVGSALWIRHLAGVLRRGFETAHPQK
jgi:hypothetical protein